MSIVTGRYLFLLTPFYFGRFIIVLSVVQTHKLTPLSFVAFVRIITLCSNTSKFNLRLKSVITFFSEILTKIKKKKKQLEKLSLSSVPSMMNGLFCSWLVQHSSGMHFQRITSDNVSFIVHRVPRVPGPSRGYTGLILCPMRSSEEEVTSQTSSAPSLGAVFSRSVTSWNDQVTILPSLSIRLAICKPARASRPTTYPLEGRQLPGHPLD